MADVSRKEMVPVFAGVGGQVSNQLGRPRLWISNHLTLRSPSPHVWLTYSDWPDTQAHDPLEPEQSTLWMSIYANLKVYLLSIGRGFNGGTWQLATDGTLLYSHPSSPCAIQPIPCATNAWLDSRYAQVMVETGFCIQAGLILDSPAPTVV